MKKRQAWVATSIDKAGIDPDNAEGRRPKLVAPEFEFETSEGRGKQDGRKDTADLVNFVMFRKRFKDLYDVDDKTVEDRWKLGIPILSRTHAIV